VDTFPRGTDTGEAAAGGGRAIGATLCAEDGGVAGKGTTPIMLVRVVVWTMDEADSRPGSTSGKGTLIGVATFATEEAGTMDIGPGRPRGRGTGYRRMDWERVIETDTIVGLDSSGTGDRIATGNVSGNDLPTVNATRRGKSGSARLGNVS